MCAGVCNTRPESASGLLIDKRENYDSPAIQGSYGMAKQSAHTAEVTIWQLRVLPLTTKTRFK